MTKVSTILTDDEITKMRSDIKEVSLPDTCNILTNSPSRDSEGGFSDSWGTAVVGAKCRLENLSNARMFQHEELQGLALRGYSDWILTLPHDVDIAIDQRVEHGGNTYAVTSLVDYPSWLLFRRANLDRLSGNA